MSTIKRTGIAILALAVALAIGSSAALAKGKNHASGARGKVTAVDSSSITISSKKHGAKTFQLAATTVYETKGKKHSPNTPATLADVKPGEHVKIEGTTTAMKVVISAGGHKHNAKKNK